MKRPFAVFANLAIALRYCITVQAQEIPKQYQEALRILGQDGSLFRKRA